MCAGGSRGRDVVCGGGSEGRYCLFLLIRTIRQFDARLELEYAEKRGCFTLGVKSGVKKKKEEKVGIVMRSGPPRGAKTKQMVQSLL